MFRTNYDGELRYSFVSKQFYLGVFLEPVIYAFITLLVYLSVGTKSIFIFYLILVYIIAWYSFGMYATIRMIRSQNRTITEIDFNNDEIKIGTDYLLWYDGLEFRIKKSEIQFKKRKFENYGKKTIKEGLQFNIDGLELYFIKDYFDDYDEIVKMLS